ncbi:UNVERIFIED_CONTAM: hypothetical protein GTU68_061705 [Idotea baltica]|nr:hypothetical protein [Idotea baltica]
MNVEVLTPDTLVFEGEAKVVTLPGLGGKFQIMDNHAPLIAALGAGTVTIDKQEVQIASGFVEVVDNKVTVLAESSKG